LIFGMKAYAPHSPSWNDDSDGSNQSEPADNNSGQTPPPAVGADGKSQVIQVGEQTRFSKSLAVGPVGKLKMDVDCGDVKLTGSDDNTVEIKVDRDVTHA